MIWIIASTPPLRPRGSICRTYLFRGRPVNSLLFIVSKSFEASVTWISCVMVSSCLRKPSCLLFGKIPLLLHLLRFMFNASCLFSLIQDKVIRGLSTSALTRSSSSWPLDMDPLSHVKLMRLPTLHIHLIQLFCIFNRSISIQLHSVNAFIHNFGN